MNYWLLQLVTKLSLSLWTLKLLWLWHTSIIKSLFIIHKLSVEWSDISYNHLLGNRMVAQSIKNMEKGCTSLGLQFACTLSQKMVVLKNLCLWWFKWDYRMMVIWKSHSRRSTFRENSQSFFNGNSANKENERRHLLACYAWFTVKLFLICLCEIIDFFSVCLL